MMGPGFGDEVAKAFVAALVVAALVGWAVIEGALWVLRHLRVEWLP